ncbi:DegV family protein [Floccifex sp.]|uniref:DegV family protein n=1 Tax=Floccifex sp. TaxID=2815810 RepID=UPI002A74EC35|nr:DegV family protein [Floccifex sp.]MDD7281117.1 DegV family protein [Erysipelotrichaceae bacterium]MDY2957782.1 DegV family protein [Floccifex sp.]
MIRIITDSGCDISQAKAKEKGIVVLPLTTIIDNQEYRDGIDIMSNEFYDKLVNSNVTPSTSQVSPGAFLDAFEQYKDDDILCITISSKLSGCFQSACLAAKEFDNVKVIDSQLVSLASHIFIELAVSYVEQGLDIDTIVSKLEQDKLKCRAFAYFDTLEYLKRGGRISATTATAGTLLNIKPIATLQNGVLDMLGKVRGVKKAGSFVVDKIKEKGNIDTSRPVIVAYSGNDEQIALNFIEKNKETLGLDTVEIMQIGPTIGTHAGPGAVAISYFEQ